MEARQATSEDWRRYYAETAPRGQHGKNDPIERQRARLRLRERIGLALGLAALAASMVAYLALT